MEIQALRVLPQEDEETRSGYAPEALFLESQERAELLLKHRKNEKRATPELDINKIA